METGGREEVLGYGTIERWIGREIKSGVLNKEIFFLKKKSSKYSPDMAFNTEEREKKSWPGTLKWHKYRKPMMIQRYLLELGKVLKRGIKVPFMACFMRS